MAGYVKRCHARKFEAPCFQLVQQSYTKSEILAIVMVLESNIA